MSGSTEKECDATILIADDDHSVVELLKNFLRPLGCDIITAKDGEEALRMSQEQLPDVVLLDVMMPKRSGWEVCQALKGVERTSAILVVLMTGRGDVKDRLAGLQVGADDYLVKPFQRQEVTRRVADLVERKAAKKAAGAQRPEASNPLLNDPATGMPTIHAVMPKLKELLIEQGGIEIVFIDIEQFEAIEADYGWAFFDEFLRNVSEAVEKEAGALLGRVICSISRVAGWNFYIFVEKRPHSLEERSIEERLRERLVAALRGRFPQMHATKIGFFIGCSEIDYEPQIRVERQVYQGMQRAMDTVRDAEAEQKRRLSRELRDIIRRKRVSTLFQPIVRSTDGSVFGYEVLTRGPAHSSFINSDMLFSFARDAKLSWDLESLALESTLRTLRSIDLGDRKFLLNLEAEMFGVTDFRFHEIVDFFAQQRGKFVFELTERAAIEDYAAFRDLLDKFREKGIEIAIDDAGSGYASLEAIASLAPDYLKVTKGLISAIATEPIKQDLVKMLVDLAGRIGAKTIAEGIETLEEYNWCRKLGVDLMQGYYIARPQPRIDTVGASVPSDNASDRARPG